jgi:hypothetical protein
MGPGSYNELVWVSTSSTSMSLVHRITIGICTFDEGCRTDCFSIAALSIKISRVEFINNLLSVILKDSYQGTFITAKILDFLEFVTFNDLAGRVLKSLVSVECRGYSWIGGE